MPGPAIKVGVSFTDDEGYSETSTSSATASVPEPAPQTPPPPVIVPPKSLEFARASHQIWSASLTVRSSSGVLGCSNGVADNFCSVHLTDDDFNHDSTDYVIDLIFLTRAEPGDRLRHGPCNRHAGLTLNVDGTPSPSRTPISSRPSSGDGTVPGLSWTTGNIVSLTLTPAAIAPDAPTAPRGLNATAVGDNRINLTWDAPSSDGGFTITGYKIEVSSNGNSWTTRVANTGNANRTYSHTGLSTGDSRHYRVSAINSSGTGPTSNVARAAPDCRWSASGTPPTTEGGDIVFVITISPPIDGFLSVGYGTGIDSIPSGSMGARKDYDYIPHHPRRCRRPNRLRADIRGTQVHHRRR